jgi:hypothetical protein
VIGVQDKWRMGQTGVIRTIREFSCTLRPGVGVFMLTRSFLLHVVASVQLAIVAIWTRLRVSKTGTTSSVYRSRRGGHDVSIAVGISSITIAVTAACRSSVPVRNGIGICESPKCPWVKLHTSSHVNIMLPSIMRKRLCSNHRKRCSEWNVHCAV